MYCAGEVYCNLMGEGVLVNHCVLGWLKGSTGWMRCILEAGELGDWWAKCTGVSEVQLGVGALEGAEFQETGTGRKPSHLPPWQLHTTGVWWGRWCGVVWQSVVPFYITSHHNKQHTRPHQRLTIHPHPFYSNSTLDGVVNIDAKIAIIHRGREGEEVDNLKFIKQHSI